MEVSTRVTSRALTKLRTAMAALGTDPTGDDRIRPPVDFAEDVPSGLNLRQNTCRGTDELAEYGCKE